MNIQHNKIYDKAVNPIYTTFKGGYGEMNEEMTTKETQINTNSISTQQKHLNNGKFFNNL